MEPKNVIPTPFHPIFPGECNFVFYHFGWLFAGSVSVKCGTLLSLYSISIQTVLSITIVGLDVVTLVALMAFRVRFSSNLKNKNKFSEQGIPEP